MKGHIKSSQSLTIYWDGDVTTCPSDHPLFDKACEAVDNDDFELALEYMQPIRKVQNIGYGFEVENGLVMFDGQLVQNAVCERILEAVDHNAPVTHLAAFLWKLRQNPSENAVTDLYRFLEANQLPILENGNFLAYKLIRNDWKDVFSGKIDNSIGQRPSMKRNEVVDDRNQTCARGLHVCGFEYLKSYSGQRLVAVEVNPMDVVSVPVDYHNTKMRVCDYYVREELSMDLVGGSRDFLAEHRNEYLPEAYDDFDRGYDEGRDHAYEGTYTPAQFESDLYYEGYDEGYYG